MTEEGGYDGRSKQAIAQLANSKRAPTGGRERTALLGHARLAGLRARSWFRPARPWKPRRARVELLSRVDEKEAVLMRGGSRRM